ncbi:hypothetical protein NLI96_g9302 [Meripilus lineatus]|uniref:Uncharacterized protein n=1 Tax=Meripilus lineatus TaxID=2056292 RepID=A0AAD5YD18_9APHY|nr:hypothetical protein NLI96_g9302 [Physisporinus lineatus]
MDSSGFPDYSSNPSLATGLQESRYLIVALAAVWVWDGILAFSNDIAMFEELRFSIPDIIYILSRITVLGSIIALILPIATTVADCPMNGKAVVWLSVLSIPLNALLFLMRIRAVFHKSRYTQFVFVFLWLTVLAGSLFQPSCVKFANIPLPIGNFCVPITVNMYCATTSVTVMVFDTTVFLAISGRLLLYTLAESWSGRIRLFFSGNGIPRLSKMLMRSGQQYYLISALVNIAAVALLFAPSLQLRPGLRSLGIVPSLVIHNIMACRVYREVKLGLLSNTGNSHQYASMNVYSSSRPSTLGARNSLPLNVFHKPSSSTHP